MFKLVEKFNRDIIGIKRNKLLEINEKEFTWFLGVLNEEINELKDAHTNHDFVLQVDSIIDLIYFAIGGLVRMGISAEKMERIFKVVNIANMNKIKGKKEARDVKHNLDAIKPEGWTDPYNDILKILQDKK